MTTAKQVKQPKATAKPSGKKPEPKAPAKPAKATKAPAKPVAKAAPKQANKPEPKKAAAKAPLKAVATKPAKKAEPPITSPLKAPAKPLAKPVAAPVVTTPKASSVSAVRDVVAMGESRAAALQRNRDKTAGMSTKALAVFKAQNLISRLVNLGKKTAGWSEWLTAEINQWQRAGEAVVKTLGQLPDSVKSPSRVRTRATVETGSIVRIKPRYRALYKDTVADADMLNLSVKEIRGEGKKSRVVCLSAENEKLLIPRSHLSVNTTPEQDAAEDHADAPGAPEVKGAPGTVAFDPEDSEDEDDGKLDPEDEED